MNKSLVIAAVLMAAALTGILATTTMAVYADRDYDDDDDDDHERDNERYDDDDDNGNGDSSETNTEQKLKQSNIGSGNNTNCGQNLIGSEGIVCFDPSVNVTDDTIIPL